VGGRKRYLLPAQAPHDRHPVRAPLASHVDRGELEQRSLRFRGAVRQLGQLVERAPLAIVSAP
jgi:hypothetical protein